MVFPGKHLPEDLLWWDLLATFPALADDPEASDDDPEAGVVAAVGIFTMLQLHYWRGLPPEISGHAPAHHRTDDAPPAQAAGS